MTRRETGGRKQPHDEATRREATDYAERHGPAAAGAKFKIAPGTIRSWLRRRAVKAAERVASDDGLEQIRREGQALVEKWEARVARELEFYGPPPLAVGEYLSPDPYEGRRPPPGTPWPPVASGPVELRETDLNEHVKVPGTRVPPPEKWEPKRVAPPEPRPLSRRARRRARKERLRAQQAAAQERVRLATIRFVEASAGDGGRVEAEVELTEAKLRVLELREELESCEW